jgi:hypothetical protein
LRGIGHTKPRKDFIKISISVKSWMAFLADLKGVFLRYGLPEKGPSLKRQAYIIQALGIIPLLMTRR